MIIGRLIPAGTGLPRYRSLEPATPNGEQIIIEAPVREERVILPVDVDESLSAIGSSFTDNVDKVAEAGLGANPLVEELAPHPPIMGARSADDLLKALFEDPLPDVDDDLTDAELDEGDDESLSLAEELPGEIEIPAELLESDEAKESAE